ncbi:hypothetical protein [Oxalicibacterium faecigallinarum]|uniref:Tip attachment protein J domain-containing protein n=1 Tax=Oxalicibacterium faecigallinarum TaxID=573741 RepID=A0A8J3EYZ0_9BURK|nr:hypothetical protein [Oxalicibacterium faecigallinarum]GGI16460.1 hypothetical protein GCM10008066_04070 [Oxalicibacterium faecigallinarum]
MRLVIALLILLLPVGAQAEPVTAFLGTVAFAGVTYGQIILFVGTMVYGMAQQKKAERRQRAAAAAQRDAYNAGLQDRTLNRMATDSPYTFVYGRARVGGDLAGILTSGSRDEYQHVIIVHAAHECDGVEEFYVNGEALGPLDANGDVTTGKYVSVATGTHTQQTTASSIVLTYTPVTGTVTGLIETTFDFESGQQGWATIAVSVVGSVVTFSNPGGKVVQLNYQYRQVTSMVRVRTHLGTPDDPVDAHLHATLPSKWPATSVLRGLTYSVVTLNLNQPEFQNGLPQLEILLRGKKLLNFRTGETVWSQNPAEVIYDYLLSDICGVDAADLPMADYIAAANDCDDAITIGPRYTFNGTVTSDMNQSETLERMAQAMAGGIVATTWGIYAGKYSAPVMALFQDDIVGAFALTPGISDADLYNGVRGQYTGVETGYVATDFAPYQNAAFVEADGRELWTDIPMPFTDALQRAHNLCRIFTEDQRNAYMFKAEFSLKTWRLRVGQRITMTSPLFGWQDKVFRVTDKRFSPSSMVELSLKVDDPSIWDEADAVQTSAQPNTNLPNPFDISPLASLSCQSGSEHLIAKDGTIISRILVTWPVATTPSVVRNGQIEVEWQLVGADVWNKVAVSGSDTEVYVSPAEDGSFYKVRGRAVNSTLNVKSDWTYAALHQVVGKTAPPANMQNLSITGSVLSWAPNRELDLKGYIFRSHYGNNLDWNSAAPLHEGVITEMPFELVTRPNGVVTIMGKCLDTSGNESMATANIVTNLGDPVIANVVEVFDFHGDGFPGELQGAVLEAGDLVALETDSFYGSDNQSAYGPDNEPAYALSSYAQLRYTTEEVSVASVLAGSIMTLEIEYQGIDLFIEYRLAGPGSAYGADSDSAYGPDEEPFYGGPGVWQPWPGQILAANDVYQWRVTLGAGSTQARITELTVTIDAPDLVEYLEDVLIDAAGTVVPYTKNFRSIKTVTPTLQANASGAVTIEADKSTNLAPVLRAYNAAHVPVSGATADVIVKGY